MGSPISPVFAEFLLQDLERSIIPSIRSVHHYLRYVDNVFSVAKKNDSALILDKLNGYHPEIQFTCEIMENNKLPFLDTMIEIKSNFTLGFSIYRKPTNTDKYLDFHSNHPFFHKCSVIDTLVYRALKICDDDKIDTEIEHVTTILRLNHYPIKLIKSRIDRMKATISSRSNSNTNVTVPVTANQMDLNSQLTRRLVIPYTGTLSLKIARVIRSITDIQVCYRPVNKLSTLLSNNNQISTNQIGIYKLKCNDCPKIYVGESGRDIISKSTRTLE